MAPREAELSLTWSNLQHLLCKETPSIDFARSAFALESTLSIGGLQRLARIPGVSIAAGKDGIRDENVDRNALTQAEAVGSTILVRNPDVHDASASVFINSFLLGTHTQSWRVRTCGFYNLRCGNSGLGIHHDGDPHLVLFQMEGRRRLQAWHPLDETEAVVSRQVKVSCDPVFDEELYPGDLVYLPPRTPHLGRALTPSSSLTVSASPPLPDEEPIVRIGRTADAAHQWATVSLSDDWSAALAGEAVTLGGLSRLVNRTTTESYADGTAVRSAARFREIGGGKVLSKIHNSSSLRALARSVLGRPSAPTRSAYLLYEAGDFLGLHTDAPHSALTFIGAPLGQVPPVHMHSAFQPTVQEIFAIIENSGIHPSEGIAVPIPNRGFVSLVGSIPHHRPPVSKPSIIATMSFKRL